MHALHNPEMPQKSSPAAPQGSIGRSCSKRDQISAEVGDALTAVQLLQRLLEAVNHDTVPDAVANSYYRDQLQQIISGNLLVIGLIDRAAESIEGVNDRWIETPDLIDSPARADDGLSAACMAAIDGHKWALDLLEGLCPTQDKLDARFDPRLSTKQAYCKAKLGEIDAMSALLAYRPANREELAAVADYLSAMVDEDRLGEEHLLPIVRLLKDFAGGADV